MKIKLLSLMLSLAVLGCRSVRFTDQMLSDMHEAKALVSQIHRGMKRVDVEAMLHPMPYHDLELNISGVSIVHYLLKPNVMVVIDYSANEVVLPPTELQVTSDRVKYSRYKSIPLSQIE